MSPAPKKECPICCAEVAKFGRSPSKCAARHNSDQRACEECWEAYLSKEVEAKDPRHIECMFSHAGNSIVNRSELARLMRDGTLERYDEKLKESTHFRCQARCVQSRRDPDERNSPSMLQPHSRRINGRVFQCPFCPSRTCIDCDRPEHDNEACEQYRERVVKAAHHLRAEEATATSFKRCPNCNSVWEWDEKGKGCGYTRCEACKYRFCGNCMIPWVGDGSAYLLGKMAHGKTANGQWCRYRTKDAESTYSLKKRFQPDAETQARLDAKKEVKDAKKEMKEAKRKAAAMVDDGGDRADLAGLVSKRIKKQKLLPAS